MGVTAYTTEQRHADMCREIKRAFDGGWLSQIRPGYFAGTYGVTKDEVRSEIRKYNELAGDEK